MDDMALNEFDEDFTNFNFNGNWQLYGDLQLKLEHWADQSHSHLEFIGVKIT